MRVHACVDGGVVEQSLCALWWYHWQVQCLQGSQQTPLNLQVINISLLFLTVDLRPVITEIAPNYSWFVAIEVYWVLGNTSCMKLKLKVKAVFVWSACWCNWYSGVKCILVSHSDTPAAQLSDRQHAYITNICWARMGPANVRNVSTLSIRQLCEV